METNINKLSKVAAAFVTLLLVTACNQIKFAPQSSDKPAAVTHNDLLGAENSEVQCIEEPCTPVPPNPTDFPSDEQHKIQVQPQVIGRCALGELDIIQSIHACAGDTLLITTVKDLNGERVINSYAFPSSGFERGPAMGGGTATLASSIVTPASLTITGSEVDIFVCMDTNKNGKCADEAINSLNALMMDRLQLSNLLTCKGAMVFYHKHYSFNPDAPAPAAQAALYIWGQLQNIDDTPKVIGDGITLFSPPLARYQNIGNCPVSDRTNGCFAKGTKLSVGKNRTVAIEKLRAGLPVMLVNGQMSMIKKVIAGPELKPMIHFATADKKRIAVTSEHPLMTQSGVKLAKDISIGDQLATQNGKLVEITSIQQKAYKDKVYNVELEGPAIADHLIIAEGLVSGDLYLQNRLSGQKKGVDNLQAAH